MLAASAQGHGRMRPRWWLFVALMFLVVLSKTTLADEDMAPTEEPPEEDDPAPMPTEEPSPSEPAPTDPAPTDPPPSPTPEEDEPSPTEEPPSPTEEPPPPTEEPPSPTEEPPAPTEEAPAPTEEPEEENTPRPTSAPDDDDDDDDTPSPTDAPPPPTEEPPSPTEEPPAPTEEPPAPTEEPPAPTDEPPAPTDEPPAPTDEPEEENTPRPTSAPTDEDDEDDDDTPSPTDAPRTPNPTKEDEDTEAPTSSPTDSEETTDAPTESPTETPTTFSPTETPTIAPTVETLSPSEMPTTSSPTKGSVFIQDDVSVIISPVTTVMSSSDAKHFESTAQTFLSDLLIQLEQPIYDVNVTVTGGSIVARRRRRRLQESMQVDMLVSGYFDPVPGLAETEDDYSIGRVSRQFFNVQGDKFVKMLKKRDAEEESEYFSSVASVESVAVADDNVAPPSQTPQVQAPTGGGPGLQIGGIVGIALVGALVVALGAAFILRGVRKRNLSDAKRARAARKSKRSSSQQNSSSPKRSSAANNARESEQPPPVRAIGGPSDSDRDLRRVDSDAQSDLQSGYGAEESYLGVESNMSYAYSLEDGIGNAMSVNSVGTPVNYGEANTPIPAEIGRVPSREDRTSGRVDVDDDDNDDLDIDKSFSANSNTILRDITAPPGKLGVILNTSEKGPVVQEVAPGSPLEGMVWPGDLIVSIDGFKTRSMSAASLTQYMSENMGKNRKLTILNDLNA